MLAIVNTESSHNSFSASSPKKISTKKGRSFSLPAGPDFSCPGATNACVDCYAQKGRHHFANVKHSFAKNWHALLNYEKEKDEVGCALEICKIIPNKGLFRIHESGDFHSQFAVNVWSKVVSANPGVSFFAYTRSFNLNYEPLLEFDNFNLWASTDKFNQSEAKRFVYRYSHYHVKHAYGPYNKSEALPKDSFICPATNGKIKLDGACEKCKLCVHKNRTKRNVVFHIH